MRLQPIPIPSDASKAPILPGLPFEWNDLMAFVFLLLPAVALMSYKPDGKINFTLVIIAAIPGLIASIPLVIMPEKDSQRGWERLLAWIRYRFWERRQWHTTAMYPDDYIEEMEVKPCGKAETIEFIN